MIILEAQNLSKIYKVGENEISAIRNISLTVNNGEFISIIGKSGSGKSTLMHMLGLLDTPTAGSLKFEGQEVSDFNEARLARMRNKKIGFVFQTFNLFPRVSALDNVILPLRYSSVPKGKWADRAKEVLNIVDLAHRLDNKSNELSGGQKQRVALARALVNKPSIIFADEPTGNLDSKTGGDIADLFIKLNEQGKTVIIVTHDPDLAKIAKRVITLKDGRIKT